jgi:hypothetical protein
MKKTNLGLTPKQIQRLCKAFQINAPTFEEASRALNEFGKAIANHQEQNRKNWIKLSRPNRRPNKLNNNKSLTLWGFFLL